MKERKKAAAVAAAAAELKKVSLHGLMKSWSGSMSSRCVTYLRILCGPQEQSRMAEAVDVGTDFKQKLIE